jgi:hypothetical protein
MHDTEASSKIAPSVGDKDSYLFSVRGPSAATHSNFGYSSTSLMQPPSLFRSASYESNPPNSQSVIDLSIQRGGNINALDTEGNPISSNSQSMRVELPYHDAFPVILPHLWEAAQARLSLYRESYEMLSASSLPFNGNFPPFFSIFILNFFHKMFFAHYK